MVQRLGWVLYWTGCTIATLHVLVGILVLAGKGSSGEGWMIFSFILFGALCFWALGRAFRYVLTGA